MSTPAGLIAPAASAGATLGFDTATAGARSGSVTFGFETDGTGTSGLAAAPIDPKTVAVNVNVFALANPQVVANLDFGSVIQGSVQTRAITVSNPLLAAVPAGFQEGLRAAFGAISPGFSGTGVIGNLAAGLTDAVTLIVTLDTSSAGARSGTVEVLLASNGAGTSGLGLLDLPSVLLPASATVSGSVFRLAQADVAPLFIDLGNRRVGDPAPAPAALTITNTAANDGFSERLDAQVGATTGRAAGAGTISLLDPQASSTAISVGIDTSAAGPNGTMGILLNSNGLGTSGGGITPLPGQTVVLGGGVYRLAQADVSGSATLVARVGDSAGAVVQIRNTALADGFSEQLGVTGTATGSGVSFGAADGLLAAGGQRMVSATVDTSSAGAKSGTLNLAFTSDGTGTSGLAPVALAGGSATVNAAVYAPAVADVGPLVIDFGTVRVGDPAPTRQVMVRNAATGALVDQLLTSVGSSPSGVGVSAPPGPLASGQTGTIDLDLDTSVARTVAGSLSLDFISRNPTLSDLALATIDVALAGTVNNLANAVFTRSGSPLTFDPGLGGFVFNAGTVAQGGMLSLGGFGLGNLVVGPADDLTGLVTAMGTSVFSLAAPFDIGTLAAGQVAQPFAIMIDRSVAGIFTGQLGFAGRSINASDPSGLLSSAQLFLRVQIAPASMPTPATPLLLVLGLGLLGLRRRAARHARQDGRLAGRKA